MMDTNVPSIYLYTALAIIGTLILFLIKNQTGGKIEQNQPELGQRPHAAAQVKNPTTHFFVLQVLIAAAGGYYWVPISSTSCILLCTPTKILSFSLLWPSISTSVPFSNLDLLVVEKRGSKYNFDQSRIWGDVKCRGQSTEHFEDIISVEVQKI